MSQVVHNLGITYGNNNCDCGNTTNNEFNQCNISVSDEKRQILEWISPFASRERHQAVRDSRVEKVGDWLLRNKGFSTWHTSEDRTAKPVLFCYGHPGAGKTYISSLVIDTLFNGIDGDGVAVAYVYCDFATRNMQSTSAVFGSVLRQVVGALAKIPDRVQGMFEKAKRQADGCGLRLLEILDMLTNFLPSLKRAFICIDALDEFPTKQRAQLWKSLQSIVRGCPNTRLFLTGRPQIRTEVKDYFPGEVGMVTIEPTEEDIKRYIEERLEGDLDKSTIDEELRADIKNVIPKGVSGIFLLVCLGVDEILAATTIYHKRQALDRMVNGLGLQEAYNTTLDRIRQQGRGKSNLGMATLMWVSRSERPMNWKELRHALGVDLDAGEFTIDNVPSVRTVLGCTLGLVTIDEYASTVRLLHLTLQEYLGASPTVFETPQSIMAEICLTYLNSPLVKGSVLGPYQAQEWPFFKYATCFWGKHAAREVTEGVVSRALRLLDGYENHASAKVLGRERIRKDWLGNDVYRISGLHCIAFWGITEIAVSMLEKKKWDVNGPDSRGDTPLMWAVRYGNDRVVELLLKQGDIRPDIIVQDGHTVLSFGVASGNIGAVKLLLEHGDVNPDLSDTSGRTPLSLAASMGRDVMVKVLLGRGGVNPNLLDSTGWSPLSLAAAKGHPGVVKHLVESQDIDPNSSDRDGLTPLSYAAKWGREDLVKRFLEYEGINPNLSDSNGRTPLSFAAWKGYESIVRLLLDRWDVNPNHSGKSGQTPLLYAASGGSESVVKLLLECKEVNPDSPDIGGRTPLSFSASGGHGGMVQLLLEREEVNPDSLDRNGRTPLSYAAARGRPGVVKILLSHRDVNLSHSDRTGRTPLFYANNSGDRGVLNLLLEHYGVNPNSQDINDWTFQSYIDIINSTSPNRKNFGDDKGAPTNTNVMKIKNVNP